MQQPTRADVWYDLSQHFLDTETRPAIPASAELCLRAGFSIEQAFDIWRYEVSPVLWPNLWSVAGEWGGWDREWLVARVESVCARSAHRRRGWLAALGYRTRVHFNHRVWLAIAACMAELSSAPVSARRELASRLGWLARHYFDFCGAPAEENERAALAALYRGSFRRIFEPLVFRDRASGESTQACALRVERALVADELAPRALIARR